MSWTGDTQDTRRRARRRRITTAIETTAGVFILMSGIPITVWLTENNAPLFVQMVTGISVFGFGMALIMENKLYDNLS